MGASKDFWLYVHELTLCIEGEGVTTWEQRASILAALDSMPPMARQEIIRELLLLVAELSAIGGEASVRSRIDV